MAVREGPAWRWSRLSVPEGARLTLTVFAGGGLIALSGFMCLILSLFTGPAVFDYLWGVEPLAYIGGVALMVGLAISITGLAVATMRANRRNQGEPDREHQSEQWRETTRQFFELVDHDLGRPLRRIAGKERELRAAIRAAGGPDDPAVQELMDEIARQTPNFRLMLSNIQVLVQLEAPGGAPPTGPVEPSEVVRRIADRYFPVAAEASKELTWWAEPPEFGIVSSDSHAIEHIVTNLVDNAVTHAAGNVEISLSKDDTRFYVQVWDDGPGIASHYLEYLFDRGWTPEVGRREEKTSSGLGLFIARRLAQRCGGELTVESVAAPQADHHTAFLLALPLKGQ
jgi:signal transduction histidine kinase